MKAEEIKRHVGKRVTVRLAPGGSREPAVTGRLVGTLDAVDGLVVYLEPDGAKPGTRLAVHYHHILGLVPS
jgi:uncharacterized protein Veg